MIGLSTLSSWTVVLFKCTMLEVGGGGGGGGGGEVGGRGSFHERGAVLPSLYNRTYNAVAVVTSVHYVILSIQQHIVY